MVNKVKIWFAWKYLANLFRAKNYDSILYLIKKYSFKTYAEVGVDEAHCALHILKYGDCKEVFLIDNYANPDDPYYNAQHYKQSKETAYQKTHAYNPHWIYKPSLEAVKQFADKSLDIVFIDANHTYKDVKEDIKAWLPKIRKGGCLALHDYSLKFIGVANAVNESLPTFELLPDDVAYYIKK